MLLVLQLLQFQGHMLCPPLMAEIVETSLEVLSQLIHLTHMLFLTLTLASRLSWRVSWFVLGFLRRRLVGLLWLVLLGVLFLVLLFVLDVLSILPMRLLLLI